nr:MAG TPA: hypothetical protein [Caudoviricetes sp.]
MSTRDIISNVERYSARYGETIPLGDDLAGDILSALTAANHRIIGPAEPSSTVDDMAAAMWKAEAEDAGSPPSVAERRTRQAFAEQATFLKAKWRKLARAAINSLLGASS